MRVNISNIIFYFLFEIMSVLNSLYTWKRNKGEDSILIPKPLNIHSSHLSVPLSQCLTNIACLIAALHLITPYCDPIQMLKKKILLLITLQCWVKLPIQAVQSVVVTFFSFVGLMEEGGMDVNQGNFNPRPICFTCINISIFYYFFFFLNMYHHCLSFRCDQHCVIKNIYK